MQVSVSLFQRRQSKLFFLTPVCSGLFQWTSSSRDLAKARQFAIERLRKELRTLEVGALGLLYVPMGRALERVRLEFTVRDSGAKKHVAGVFPLVVEKRIAGVASVLTIAYHPLKAEAWFEVNDTVSLAEQAQSWFANVFEPEDDFDRLKATASDQLFTQSFDATPKSLLSLLDEDSEGQRAGAGGGALLEQLLKGASDETRRAADNRLEQGLVPSPLRTRLQQLLCGGKKSSVLLVGPAGSGKSTVIAGAVADLLSADEYATHGNLDRVHRVLRLQGRHIIAGMSYLGQWEARSVALLEYAAKHRVVLWVEDLHSWGSLGRTTGSDRRLADFFRAPLARGELCIVAECTPEQLTLLEYEAPELAACFAEVRVPEASAAETIAILLHHGRRLESEFNLVFDPHCYRTLIDMSRALSSHQAFPGKAVAALNALARERGRLSEGEVSSEEVTRLFSRQTGLPRTLLSPELALERTSVERELSLQIIGQPAALEVAADLIMSLRAALTADGRPYAVFLFTGPTGTGKTELCKCIADYLFDSESRLVRFDMGEFGGADAVSRLIGDRAEPAGRLTSAVRAQPFCVLLFDEIEKAHPAVLNLMLQLFDDGRLTDASGAVADFSHCVVILTSNLGTDERTVRGFSEDRDALRIGVERAVQRFFSPELFNRIDRIVEFSPLDRASAERIVAKELARLSARPGLSERNIFLRFTPAVVARIVEYGYDARYGARALKRVLEERVVDILADAITREASAEMRLLWLYVQPVEQGQATLGVGVLCEALEEAELRAGESELIELLELDSRALLAKVPQALTQLREFEEAQRFEKLGDALAESLKTYQRAQQQVSLPGAREHSGDLVYNLDTLRAHVQRLRRRLHARVDGDVALQAAERARKRQAGELLSGQDYTTLSDRPRLRARDRGNKRLFVSPGRVHLFSQDSLLNDLSEVQFLGGLLDSADDPRAHVAVVEVLGLGWLHQRRRFEAGASGLFGWLVLAYMRCRGRLERAAAAFPDGSFRELTTLDELEAALEQGPRQVLLKLVGPGIGRFLSGETGCVVRRTRQGTEVVRTRVVPDTPDLLTHLEQHAACRRAFEAGLEGGARATNPEALLPVIRSLSFEPDLSLPATLEDFRLGYVVSRKVRQPAELLHDCWRLNAAWQAPRGGT